ncbi:transporter substrate-binding domain-containing protein [Gottschalkia purinilytica]|uniref:transporter substrate-binding domain-containing protein n=1 Tax=Gottschalkia purinilytica TaxID=1503 RepID=UPI0009E5B67A|nr:transporter substrate-binding domain-containing protein [Gottschalkia purinilytica]
MLRYRGVLSIILTIFILVSESYAYGYKETLKIAGDNNYPPYEFVDENGNYKGFNVDVMNAISIELGIDIEIIPMNWNDALMSLRRGEVDIVQGMTKSLYRKSIFEFSNELVINSQAIFVRKDTSFVTEVKDLSGLKVACQKGDVSDELIRNVSDITLLEKENQGLAIEALLNNEVDAFVGNRLTGLYYLQKTKRIEDVKIVGEPMHTIQYCSATKKGDKETLAILNEGIKRIKKNGTYDKIYKKWFGESFSDTNEKWKQLFYIAQIMIIITLGFTLSVYYWNKRLKKEVEKQTREIKEKQKEIDQNDRLKGKIIESIISGIIAFDSTGKIINFNSFAKNLLEVDIQEGMTWHDIDIYERIKVEEIKRVLSNETLKKSIQWKLRNGEIKYIDCSIIPIKGPECVEGVIMYFYDYTKEKNLNEMIIHHDKMQALGKLSAGVAHELRNPLTSVKAFIDMIPEKIDNINFREQLMRIVPQELNRLNNLVSVLLDYSRPKESNPQEVYFDELIKDVLLLLNPHFKKKEIKITQKFNNLIFWADVSQTKQIILNIIVNSIDAIVKKGRIDITGHIEDDKAVIRIWDNGCGINKSNINKVFDPFYTSKKDGYGIGLSITHQLVQENKGEISIKSVKGEGTLVTIRFPIYPD